MSAIFTFGDFLARLLANANPSDLRPHRRRSSQRKRSRGAPGSGAGARPRAYRRSRRRAIVRSEACDRQPGPVGARTRRVVSGILVSAPAGRRLAGASMIDAKPTRCTTRRRSRTTCAGTCRCLSLEATRGYLDARARPCAEGLARDDRKTTACSTSRSLPRATKTCTREAFHYTRQTLGYPAPALAATAERDGSAGRSRATPSSPAAASLLGASARRWLRVRQRKVGARSRVRAVPHRSRSR